MKTLMTCFAVLALSFSHAQTSSWAPVGATWWYSQIDIMPPFDWMYHKITVTGDTVINGTSVSVLDWKQISQNDTFQRPSFYTFEDSGMVYFMAPDDPRPYLLYDFTLDKGDSVLVFWWGFGSGWYHVDSTLQIIDSIAYDTYGGVVRKVLFLETYPHSYWNGPWIEGIGSALYFFTQYSAADPPYTGPLRCYDDSTSGLIQFWSIDCDYLKPVGISFIEPEKINIHPNPATSTVRVEVPGYANSLLTLYTLTGRKVQQVPLTGPAMDVDVSGLPNGMYLVMVQDHASGGLRVGKLVVQR